MWTCTLRFALATLVTAADARDTAAAGKALERPASAGRAPERVEIHGIHIGDHMTQAAKPLPLRRRIEGGFDVLANCLRRLARSLEHGSAAIEDAVTIANSHFVTRAFSR